MSVKRRALDGGVAAVAGAVAMSFVLLTSLAVILAMTNFEALLAMAFSAMLLGDLLILPAVPGLGLIFAAGCLVGAVGRPARAYLDPRLCA